MRHLNKYQPSTMLCFVIVSLIYFNCKTNYSLLGVYHPIRKIGPDVFTLIIKSDSTFSFTSFSDLLGSTTAIGRWYKKSNQLFLKKDTMQTKSTFLKAVEIENKSYTEIRIHVVDASDNTPVVGSELEVNDDPTHYLIDTSGVVKINNNSHLKNIRFSYASIQKSLTINNPNSNEITLIVNFKNTPIVDALFVPKIWIIDKNRLIPLREKGLFEEPDNIYIRR